MFLFYNVTMIYNRDMNKKTLTIFLLLILIIVIFGVTTLYFSKQRTSELPVERASRVDISEFSFGGEIIAIGELDITLKTGWVERTDAGNKFVEHEIVVKLNSDTKMWLITGGSKLPMTTENPISNLQNNDKLTVYSQESPYNGSAITAIRIEVFR